MNIYANQAALESYFSKKLVKEKVRNALDSCKELDPVIESAVERMQYWQSYDHGYAAKNSRLAELADTDWDYLIRSILVEVLPIQRPVLISQVVGPIAGGLGYKVKRDGVITAAEILAVLTDTGLFSIFKPEDDELQRFHVVSNCSMSPELMEMLHETQYLPPMVCPPNIVERNYDRVHVTYDESMILGPQNHHNGNICLDSLNKFNQIPLELDVDLLTTYSEEPDEKINDPEKREQWTTFVRNSYKMYLELIKNGNTLYLSHKVDKRGRTYAQGYHVSTQGNGFRKAILDFKEKEYVEVPEAYRRRAARV